MVYDISQQPADTLDNINTLSLANPQTSADYAIFEMSETSIELLSNGYSTLGVLYFGRKSYASKILIQDTAEGYPKVFLTDSPYNIFGIEQIT
ncbi:hypothetical protein FBU30_008214 [Linnemannia zychae]|nr:hypothetical protein FBU30_008214 [Linnemannia zychae]